MKYISLFSGIECATLAAKPLGWTPVAFAEIEPFPAAVLAHHYPEVPNLGDVTAVDWTEYKGRADMVIGGSPCQAFSVAGRRESLAALAGHDRPINPPDGRGWPAAGVVAGPSRRLAWRVLDAQYFGVPQRRRRVYLVGCSASSGIDPGEILFEREDVCRDSAPCREAGKDTAGTFKSCSRSGGWSNSVDHAAAGYMQVSPTVTGRAPFNGTGNARVECEAFVVGAVSSKWAKGTGGPAGDECQNLVAAYGETGVRRLTPRETERLQGMPDDHTLIPYRGKPAADGPRYKAIGNGMAVPCVRWIFERIENGRD